MFHFFNLLVALLLGILENYVRPILGRHSVCPYSLSIICRDLSLDLALLSPSSDRSGFLLMHEILQCKTHVSQIVPQMYTSDALL